MTERVTLQAILRRYLDPAQPLSPRQHQVCRHLVDCRSAALGGLTLHCDHCHRQRPHYFACRDRHCPQCQQAASEGWRDKQRQHLLPARYFHLVFTLPDTLNGWVRCHPQVIYHLLFQAAWQTLQALGADPKRLGGQVGMTAFLHTWGQNLSLHPHLHCLVPGGALTEDRQWKANQGHYLFPVRALSRGFRGRLVSALRQAHRNGQLPRITDPDEPRKTLDRLMRQEWVVYCRPGIAQPEQIIDYLARYTHRSAISNGRLLDMDDGQVRFRYKDYRDHERKKVMRLDAAEFIRRFLLHVLPKGLMRIRHYGFLANACRERKLAQIRAAMTTAQRAQKIAPVTTGPAVRPTTEPFTGYPCPDCRQGLLRVIGPLPPRAWAGG
jgi:hypothetical protein